MRRSFRAATVFTGATAAAIAFVPAPAAHASSILGGNCSNPDFGPFALTLKYSSHEHHSVDACFSGIGNWPLGNAPKFVSYCGGAWSGYLWINHTAERFTPGSKFHHLYNVPVSRVLISRAPAVHDCGR
jgi:hypothetical protein